MHTLLDPHVNTLIYTHFIEKLHDVNVPDLLPLEAGAYYIKDRVYLEFERHYHMNLCENLFAVKAKTNSKFRKLSSNPVVHSIR